MTKEMSFMNLDKLISKDFSWVFEKQHDMVVGDDIDAIISSCFLHHYLGWKIKGFYVGYSKLFIEKNYDNWKDAIFVDLDISQNNIRSIGHHILQLNNKDIPFDIGHKNSLNPNLLRGVTMKNFQGKYPLGTIHFLMWLHNFRFKFKSDLQKILWVADSTWINGQSHRFRDNVYDWIKYFNLTSLMDGFEEIDTKNFERKIDEIVYSEIEKMGFDKGTGQVSSRHLGLHGFQCQFSDPKIDENKINNLIHLICNIFEWNIPELPMEYMVVEGNRKSIPISDEYTSLGLSHFIKKENVFSYVIPNYNRLNYTVF